MSTSPRQREYAVLYNPALRQTAIGAPVAVGSLTSRVNLEAISFPTSNMDVEEIFSCNGRTKTGEALERINGAFRIEQIATSFDAAWAMAEFFSDYGSPDAVAANDEVQTLTITATGGTYYLSYDGVKTVALAYDANAAAIQAALETIVGSGNITVGGTGPWTLTGSGTLADTDLKPVIPVTAPLTGGTATVTTTTPGGAARQSWEFTQSDDFQPYAQTFVIAKEGETTGILVDDAIPSTLEIRQQGRLYRIVKEYLWSGIYQPVSGLSVPACPSATYLDGTDGQVLFGAEDATSDTLEWVYTVDNGLVVEDGYTLATPFFRRMERADYRQQLFRFTLDRGYDGDVFALARANGMKGTNLALTVRAGSASDGITFDAGEAQVKFAGGAVEFGGPANRTRTLVAAEPWAVTQGDAELPVMATVVTTYSSDLLATS
jgi:hypothetical protein